MKEGSQTSCSYACAKEWHKQLLSQNVGVYFNGLRDRSQSDTPRRLQFTSVSISHDCRLRKRCVSLIFKDNREQSIGVRRSLTLQWHDSIQNGILLFLSGINEVRRSRVLCARWSSALNFVRETNHEKKCPTLRLLKLRGPRAAEISLIAREDFVNAEEFGQI
jgi:hypothetical protein